MLDASPPEDMCRLPAASLIICFWLVERGQGDGILQAGVAELHARLAAGLYQRLAQAENSSNLVVSPWSIAASLGLLQLGARGNTLAQLEATLGYSARGRFPSRDSPVWEALAGGRGCGGPPGAGGARCRRSCRAHRCLEP